MSQLLCVHIALLDNTLYSHLSNCLEKLTKCHPVTYNGLTSNPRQVNVAILSMASWYRNHSYVLPTWLSTGDASFNLAYSYSGACSVIFVFVHMYCITSENCCFVTMSTKTVCLER